MVSEISEGQRLHRELCRAPDRPLPAARRRGPRHRRPACLQGQDDGYVRRRKDREGGHHPARDPQRHDLPRPCRRVRPLLRLQHVQRPVRQRRRIGRHHRRAVHRRARHPADHAYLPHRRYRFGRRHHPGSAARRGIVREPPPQGHGHHGGDRRYRPHRRHQEDPPCRDPGRRRQRRAHHQELHHPLRPASQGHGGRCDRKGRPAHRRPRLPAGHSRRQGPRRHAELPHQRSPEGLPPAGR